MTATPTLYVDFDGVLHPADVRVTAAEPNRPRVYVRGQPTDEPLFQHTELLEQLLEPYPKLRILLPTSWVKTFGYDFAVKQLPPGLQARVIGAVAFTAPTRFDTVDLDAEGRGLTHWLALDDDLYGWPDTRRHQVVAPTDPVLGLAQPGVADELVAKLDSICVAAEDAQVEQALARPPSPAVTAESLAAGEQFRREAQAAAEGEVRSLIASKKLLPASELVARLGISDIALCKALVSGQLFAVTGPDQVPYYPAFYADRRYAKGGLGKVSKVLRGLPGLVQYQFLTRQSRRLGQTPLEALADGRLSEVLQPAQVFAGR